MAAVVEAAGWDVSFCTDHFGHGYMTAKEVIRLGRPGAVRAGIGVRPEIAQSIVGLGIDLHGVTTRASLADALATLSY